MRADEYSLVNYSDVEIIKGLIKFRHKFDPYTHAKPNYSIYEAGDTMEMDENVICIYTDLDELISKCNFSPKQSEVLHRIMAGDTVNEVARELNSDPRVINGIFDTVCNKIKKVHDTKWLYDYIYLNYCKVKWDYKKCNVCLEYKPAIKEFFYEDERNQDGLRGICKNCNITQN